MTFANTSLEGVLRIELDRVHDERGWFARTYSESDFAARGLNVKWPQFNVTRTTRRGTIRGLHFQKAPASEVKLIRCDQGKIFDVVLDARRDSPQFGKWEAFELSGSTQLYVPTGFAHGFQTLSDECVVNYQMSEPYVPELAAGVRWDDSRLGIAWPIRPPVAISKRDQSLPLLEEL
ncbi:MAG: dTDP-4-dehydrorhamnose 3,5-epimerase [Verrucomicrobia subdivision 3 bacterium]|nr:dTDP-4-dehydrorhamnose 3,5-epimerase [Limisphaerales bacterium]